jgi:hypothetical protein
MAVRPDSNLSNALIVTRTVTVATVAAGGLVKDGAADKQVQPTTDAVGAIGVITSLGPLAGAVGDKVQMAYLAGACIIPVKVGTGGSTRGLPQKVVATGITDGTTGTEVVGFATQTGVAGDLIGIVPARYKLP